MAHFTSSNATSACNLHPNANEDAYFIDDEFGGAGVFDGVGGLAHGQFAASKAAKICEQKLRKATINDSKKLETALFAAHQKLLKISQSKGALGACAAVIKIEPLAKILRVACLNVGDCRIYYQPRSEELFQVSVDDNLITQALRLEQINWAQVEKIEECKKKSDLSKIELELFMSRHVITQALGIGKIKPHINILDTKPGDLIILTTDGVYDNLTLSEFKNIVSEAKFDKLANQLVEKAKKISQSGHFRAKQDDMTAVALRFE